MKLSLGKGPPYEDLSTLGYLAYFTQLAECSKNNASCIGIDGSVSLFYQDHDCQLAQLIHEIFPNAKFIAIMRNPTERLYSAYWFYLPENHSIAGPETFHHCVEQQIEFFNNCLKHYNNSTMECVYQLQARTKVERNCNFKIRLYLGIYYVHILKYLSIFPRENFIAVRLEDLHNDPYEQVSKIWKFLGLPSSKNNEFSNIASKKANHGRNYPPMLPKTKAMLDTFYRMYNEKLARLLDDDKYLWTDN